MPGLTFDRARVRDISIPVPGPLPYGPGRHSRKFGMPHVTDPSQAMVVCRRPTQESQNSIVCTIDSDDWIQYNQYA